MTSMLGELRRKLGQYRAISGDEINFCCPKCDDRKDRYDFYVNVQKRVFNCFRCKFSGVVGELIGGGVATYIAERPRAFNGTQREYRPVQAEGYVEIGRLDVNWRSQYRSDALVYLGKRGVSLGRAREMGVGLSDAPRFRNRIIIPIVESGGWVMWAARSIYPKLEPKEIFPRSEELNCKKSDCLYGLDWVRSGLPIVIVEGIFDAERLIRSGRQAVALLGSHISDVQIGKILSKEASSIHILLDGDEAGWAGAQNAVRRLSARLRSGALYAPECPSGKDPDALPDYVLDRLLGAVV